MPADQAKINDFCRADFDNEMFSVVENQLVHADISASKTISRVM